MASFRPASIFIVGATGTIGQYITASILHAKPAFSRVSMFTSQNTFETKKALLDTWRASGINVLVGDVTSVQDVTSALEKEKPDTVVSCVGRGALHTQTELLRLAEESGHVKWFFPSEYGTDIEHGPASAGEKPHQIKLAVRKYVRENVKSMKVTYVVTGPYFDMWVNPIQGAETGGGYDTAKKEAWLLNEGDGKVGFCTMSDVGMFVVAALRHPEESFGKALKVQSFVVSPNEVLAEYEKQTGGKWTAHHTSMAEMKELEAKLWAEGRPTATGITLRRIWGEGGTLYAKNDNTVVGVEEADSETLETGVRRALKGRE